MESPDSSLTRNAAAGVVVAIAGEVPILGALVSAFSSAVGARQRERDEEFWAYVVANQQITEDRVNKIVAGADDEFVAMSHRLIREARETADSGKRRLLADVLAHGKWSEVTADDQEELLATVLAMTAREALVLGFLANPDRWLRARRVPPSTQMMFGGTRGALLRIYLGDGDEATYEKIEQAAAALEAKGLANPMLTVHMSQSGVLEPCSTPLGNRVVEFIGSTD